jgi:hypothetical protein
MWEQTAIISQYNIKGLVFKTEAACVHCTVRSEYVNKTHVNFSLSVTPRPRRLFTVSHLGVPASLSYSSTFSWTSALDWSGWSTPRYHSFPPGKEPCYLLHRRVSGPKDPSRQVQKISPSPRFGLRTFPSSYICCYYQMANEAKPGKPQKTQCSFAHRRSNA